MRLLATCAAGLSIASTYIYGSGAVRYPHYYDLSAPIAYRESAERLGFYPYDRWAVDPRQSATAAMISDLQTTGVFHSVGLIDGRTAPERLITDTIEHLEEVDRGKSEYTFPLRLNPVRVTILRS
jgi:hypothetical protein